MLPANMAISRILVYIILSCIYLHAYNGHSGAFQCLGLFCIFASIADIWKCFSDKLITMIETGARAPGLHFAIFLQAVMQTTYFIIIYLILVNILL